MEPRGPGLQVSVQLVVQWQHQHHPQQAQDWALRASELQEGEAPQRQACPGERGAQRHPSPPTEQGLVHQARQAWARREAQSRQALQGGRLEPWVPQEPQGLARRGLGLQVWGQQGVRSRLASGQLVEPLVRPGRVVQPSQLALVGEPHHLASDQGKPWGWYVSSTNHPSAQRASR